MTPAKPTASVDLTAADKREMWDTRATTKKRSLAVLEAPFSRDLAHRRNRRTSLMLEHSSVARELTGMRTQTYAICPRCASPAIHDVTRLVRGVWLAHYEDANGHRWDTSWVAVA